MMGLEIDETWNECKLTEHVSSTPPFTSNRTLQYRVENLL